MAVEPEIPDFVFLPVVAVSAIQSLQILLVSGMTANDNAVVFDTGRSISHIVVCLRVRLGVNLWNSVV